MKILLENRVYDVLKWLCLIVLPALSVCYGALAKIWGWGYAAEVAQTITAVCALVGALIGISTANHNRQKGTE